MDDRITVKDILVEFLTMTGIIEHIEKGKEYDMLMEMYDGIYCIPRIEYDDLKYKSNLFEKYIMGESSEEEQEDEEKEGGMLC